MENGKLTWRKKQLNVECRLTKRGVSKRMACREGDFPMERQKIVLRIFRSIRLAFRRRHMPSWRFTNPTEGHTERGKHGKTPGSDKGWGIYLT